MLHHIKIARKYGMPVVVAINTFATDTEAELDLIRKAPLKKAARKMPWSARHWMLGGEGAVDLAKAVVTPPKNRPFPIPLPAGFVDQGKDRNHCPRSLRRGWG